MQRFGFVGASLLNPLTKKGKAAAGPTAVTTHVVKSRAPAPSVFAAPASGAAPGGLGVKAPASKWGSLHHDVLANQPKTTHTTASGVNFQSGTDSKGGTHVYYQGRDYNLDNSTDAAAWNKIRTAAPKSVISILPPPPSTVVIPGGLPPQLPTGATLSVVPTTGTNAPGTSAPPGGGAAPGTATVPVPGDDAAPAGLSPMALGLGAVALFFLLRKK